MKKWLYISLRIMCVLAVLAIVILVPWKVVREARNVTPNQVLLNTEYGNYSQIVLYLDSFNMANKSLHGWIHFDAGVKLRQHPDALNPLDSLGNVTIVCTEPLRINYSPYLLIEPDIPYIDWVSGGPRWVIDPHNVFNAVQVDIPLGGSVTAFPFDSYYQTLAVVVYPPSEADFTKEELDRSEIGVPVQFRVIEYVPGYSLTEHARLNTMLAITIQRHWSIPVEVTIIWLGLTFASILLLVRSAKAREGGEISTILVGVAALLIAIPAMRFALVPQDISSSWTALDIMLIVPSAISLLAVLVAFLHVHITHTLKQ